MTPKTYPHMPTSDSDTSNPWLTHSTREICDNAWIHVEENQVTNPSGGEGIYGVIHYKNRAVGVVPIDEEGNTWLVGQYRYPTNTYEWEIPEGGADPGETPLDAGKRELLEETGITASQWELVLEMQLSNSTSDEISQTFLARNLSFAASRPEATEKIEVRKVPLAEACAMAADGRIKDAISVASLLKIATLLPLPKIEP
jgi:8-oxo-dGTP pyrophosphatase MutT (NUDIX family)